MQFPAGRMQLYLEEIGEPRDNALRIVVVEAATGGPAEPVPGLPGLVAMPIRTTTTSRRFEVSWSNYVSYTVTDESFYQPEDPPEVLSQLTEYASSTYLRTVMARTPNAEFILQRPMRHWQLLCLNHIIDVVSASDPAVGYV